MRLRNNCALVLTVMVAFLLINGCSDDDDPVIPDPVETGNIIINPTPDQLNASWTLTGTEKVEAAGMGDLTLTGVAPGPYTITWGDVNDWVSPGSSTQSLASGDTLTFDGVYTEDPLAEFDLVLIPPTSVSVPVTFTMGSTFEENETPHEVVISNRFHMASTEVTNEQYVAALQWALDQDPPLITVTAESVLDAMDGSTVELVSLASPYCPITYFGGVFFTANPLRPAVELSWYGAASYCDWISLQHGLNQAYDHSTWACNDGNPYQAEGYRLPTEAEWELACRAGTTTHFYTGDCLDSSLEANYRAPGIMDCPAGPYLFRTADVGSYLPNNWGLYDMHGNVMEWCNDLYDVYDGDATDPVGAEFGIYRVLRGGCWNIMLPACRSAARWYYVHERVQNYCGLRVVKSVF